MHKLLYVILSFIMGSALLSIMATFQKIYIGAPLVIHGYIVPFMFGGFTGSIVGLWVNSIKTAQKKLHELNINLEIKVQERTENLNLTNNQLKQALKEVKTLQGIIPICSYCKKIRDDHGAWDIVEAYICKHSEAQFSHGVCPECYQKQMENNG